MLATVFTFVFMHHNGQEKLACTCPPSLSSVQNHGWPNYIDGVAAQTPQEVYQRLSKGIAGV